jgi:hypothetical protein
MEKILLLLFFLPTIGFGQKIEDKKCQFKYKIQLKDHVVMCPYLGPKMISEFSKLQPCDIIKENENEIIIFNLDSLYSESFIENILLNKVGIPKRSIDYIDIPIVK